VSCAHYKTRTEVVKVAANGCNSFANLLVREAIQVQERFWVRMGMKKLDETVFLSQGGIAE